MYVIETESLKLCGKREQAEQETFYNTLAADEAIPIMEAVRLYQYSNCGELRFCGNMARLYGCIPLDSDGDNLLNFLCTLYHYGQVQGIRAERARRRKRSNIPAEHTHCIKPLTDEEVQSIMKGEAGRLDIQTTSDYFADLVEADTEETEGHSNLEKMMWIVRHAHLYGFEKALRAYNDAVKEASGI